MKKMNNKKFKKSDILEGVTMDVDTFLKNRGAFDSKKENIKVVPKGSLDKPDPNNSMMENDKLAVNMPLDKVYNIAKRAGKIAIDAESELLNLYSAYSDSASGGAPKDKVIGILKKYDIKASDLKGPKPAFRPNPEFAHLFNSSMSEDSEDDVANRGIEYGYHPELDNVNWEDFLNSLNGVPHDRRVDGDGRIFEVRLKRGDFKRINENKKWL